MIGAASVYVVEVAAIVTAGALARRSRSHIPIALLLGFGLALDAGGEAIGEDPQGWLFALRVGLGSAYPWAVLGALSVSLRGEGRLGSKGASAQHHARTLAPLAFLFACYLAALLSSGVRGPALAWCYAGAQAGLAVAMGWRVWGWRKHRSSPWTLAAHVRSGSRVTGIALAFGSSPGDLRHAPDPCAEHATRRPPTATEIAAIVCAAAEIANVPAYLGLPGWIGARSVYALAYLALIFVQSRALLGGIVPCRTSTSST